MGETIDNAVEGEGSGLACGMNLAEENLRREPLAIGS